MMKNNAIVLFLIIFVCFGCKKYEEGPSVSIFSKTKRLSGDWVLKTSEFTSKQTGDYSFTRNIIKTGREIEYSFTGWVLEYYRDSSLFTGQDSSYYIYFISPRYVELDTIYTENDYEEKLSIDKEGNYKWDRIRNYDTGYWSWEAIGNSKKEGIWLQATGIFEILKLQNKEFKIKRSEHFTNSIGELDDTWTYTFVQE
jgi:hypothetical protein